MEGLPKLDQSYIKNVTKIQRERHTLPPEIRDSQLVMQRAFVVRLGSGTEPAAGRFEGRVEEVDTGEELRFRSAEELLKFLRHRYNEALRSKAREPAGRERQ
jgi:hypothetical protein